jgi:hypothetical protein
VKRRSIKTIKTRLEDVEVGDVVNRQPDAEFGWFVVDAISTLFNGHLQLADVTEQLTVSGDHKDMVGLQLVEEITLDDRGIVVPDTPSMMAMPTPAFPVDGPGQRQSTAPSPGIDEALAAIDLLIPPMGGDADPAAEAAAAAAVATQMEGGTGAGSPVPGGVNLALVAELLEDLDVGDAPGITTSPADAAAEAAPALPPEARPVYGDKLPETPSYKNPVVVPEGTQLPRRSRAA